MTKSTPHTFKKVISLKTISTLSLRLPIIAIDAVVSSRRAYSKKLNSLLLLFGESYA